MNPSLKLKNKQKKYIPFPPCTPTQPLLPATPPKMSQCVPSWDLDDNPNPARLSLRSHSNSNPDSTMLHYEVAELTWENGQLAMHGLGPPRVPAKSTTATTNPPASKYTTWEKPRASGTLESIVNQATALPALRKAVPFDGSDDLVPWFEHHHHRVALAAAATASATMTMDALVPCSNRTSEAEQATQGRVVDPLATCVVGCSTHVGSCSGAAATTQDKDHDVLFTGKRAGEARATAEWSSRDQSCTGSATCGMDSHQMTIDTCERDRGLGSTSLGSAEHTSSHGKPFTKTTTTADDHDSVCHSSPPREAGDQDKKKGTGKSSVSNKRSRAAAIHNQSERKRRDKINQRMKTLQKLVPNSSKTDKASMLDEVIEYLKQLQAQVQMMSRMNMHPMMLPMTMQQLPMSMMAPMGMGMGMGIGIGMGMDMNTINRSNMAGISPVLHPSAFMPITSWDGSSDRIQATSGAVMPDPLSTFLACQPQVNFPDFPDFFDISAALSCPFSAILYSSNSLTPPPTMANVTPYSSSSSTSENPVVSAASSSSGAPEDVFEDACSICLEPFTTVDPSNITSCKHEYHLHCILEWSQRSKECPICCQLLVLRDSASQELLAAVGIDRHLRSRNSYSAAPTSLHSFSEDFDLGHDIPNSDVSDFDERIMQHLTAATSRPQYVCRRERQRYSGIGPSQVLAFTSPTNMSRQPYAGSPEDCPNLSYGSTRGRSASSDIPSADNFEPPASVDVNLVSSTPLNRDIPFNPSILYCQPPSDSPRRPSASEMFSFPETLKSKLSAASSRYKESISKSTRGFKEKLLAHNNSVKELGKGVQREMNAGIVGLARMIERLDLNSKQSGSSVPVFSCTGGTSNLSFKGKGVEGNVDARSLDRISGQIACDLSPNATYNSGATHVQSGNPHPKSGY